MARFISPTRGSSKTKAPNSLRAPKDPIRHVAIKHWCLYRRWSGGERSPGVKVVLMRLNW